MFARRNSLVLFAVFLTAGLPGWSQDWPQWGRNPQHTGAVNVSGQPVRKLLDDLVYDPFVAAEKADPFSSDDLGVHYQVPLTDGDDVYMEFKTGAYTSRQSWNTQVWNEKKLHRVHGHLAEAWSFESDWKPVSFLSLQTFNGPFWEPVFQAALVGNYVYVPGFGGSILKVAKSDGHLVARINPFGSTLDPDTYVAGTLTAAGGLPARRHLLHHHQGQPLLRRRLLQQHLAVLPPGPHRHQPGLPGGLFHHPAQQQPGAGVELAEHQHPELHP
jgi:hypothetical protein